MKLTDKDPACPCMQYLVVKMQWLKWSLGGAPERLPPGDPKVILGDFSVHMSNNRL